MENNSPVTIHQKIDYHNHVDTSEILHYLKRIFKEVDMAEERLVTIISALEKLSGGEEERKQIMDKLNKILSDVKSTV